jgi:hypothetical protein
VRRRVTSPRLRRWVERRFDRSLEGEAMTTHADGLLFNADVIRHIVIQGRMLGLRRERVLGALTRP